MDLSIIKDFMDRLTSWRIPGNSISVCLENKEIFSYQSGYADLENKIKMSTEKLLNIYSCTKVATVTAALQLYERGYFLLDDPLYEYIPEYRDMLVKDPSGNTVKAKSHITMRQLFTMTSGMNYVLNSPSIQKARDLTEGRMDTLTVAKCIASEPLSFHPGEGWLYSLSHDVLAAVVEVISGKRFRDYMRDNIFEPLGMNETYFHNDAVLDRMAEQYRYIDSDVTDPVKLQSQGKSNDTGRTVNVGKNVAYVLGSEYDSGGAGITTTVSDYSKFVSALANEGTGQTGERILSPGTVRLLHTDQLDERQRACIDWAQMRGYGYGLGVRTLTDIAKGGSCGSIGEFGWGGAAGATVLVDTKHRLSMFYAHHMLNPQEAYYQPRLRNVLYTALGR